MLLLFTPLFFKLVEENCLFKFLKIIFQKINLGSWAQVYYDKPGFFWTASNITVSNITGGKRGECPDSKRPHFMIMLICGIKLSQSPLFCIYIWYSYTFYIWSLTFYMIFSCVLMSRYILQYLDSWNWPPWSKL